MEWERIIGSLISGFACKLYAVGMAVWIAYEAGTFVYGVFSAASKGLLH